MTNIAQGTPIFALSKEELKAAFYEFMKDVKETSTISTTQYEQETYITREETMKALKISNQTLRTYTTKGLLKSYRLGSLILYKREEVMNAPKPIDFGH